MIFKRVYIDSFNGNANGNVHPPSTKLSSHSGIHKSTIVGNIAGHNDAADKLFGGGTIVKIVHCETIRYTNTTY